MSRSQRLLYRALLRALPRALRDAHGEEMETLFEEELARARSRGLLAGLGVWVGVTADVVRRAPYELFRHRTPHSSRREHRMRSFLADIRFAVRSFARQPGTTSLLVVTLGLAVAANTAVFSMLDGLFFKPFPFTESARLVYLNEKAPRWNLEFTGINYPDFDIWRTSARAFESMALFSTGSVNLAEGNSTERAQAGYMTYDLPEVLRVTPVVGRTFTPEEDRPKAPKVVLIGYGLWKTRFGGERSAVGRTIRIFSEAYTIVGVLPTEMEFPGAVKLWLPLRLDANTTNTSYSYDGIGRLRAGVMLAAAQRDLDRVHPAVWAKNDHDHNVSPRVMTLRDRFASQFSAVGRALGVGVMLVLLIACANVAGTMLARSVFRRREIGIRVALGASGGRVTRQLLTESLTLAAVAGAGGTLLGVWGLHLLVASNPDLLPAWVTLGVSVRTVGFSTAIVCITAVLFGAVPTLQLRGNNVSGQLLSGGVRTTGSLPERRLLNALVGAEVALAVVLLVSGLLLARTYANLRDIDPGFRPDGVATFRVTLPDIRYDNGIKQRAFFEALLDRLKALPDVDHAGAVTCPPFTCHWGNFFRAEGAPARGAKAQDPVTLTRYATPDYFRAMGIHLVHGRVFVPGEGNAQKGFRPVVINQELASRLWPGVADPTGKLLTERDDTSSNWSTVVGVVRDVKHYGVSKPMRPGLYFPLTRMDSVNTIESFAVQVHTTRDVAALFPAIRAVVRSLDAELPVYRATTMAGAVQESLAQERTLAFAIGAFAAIALVLAVGGIYAMLSYVVGRRRHEIGIRMALGAQTTQVLALVVRQGLALVAVGLLLGIPVALAVSRLLDSMLVGVTSHDIVTYVVVAGVLAVTGATAALIPARRAAEIEPKSVLVEGT